MELDVVSGATTVAISSANLGHELMRAPPRRTRASLPTWSSATQPSSFSTGPAAPGRRAPDSAQFPGDLAAGVHRRRQLHVGRSWRGPPRRRGLRRRIGADHDAATRTGRHRHRGAGGRGQPGEPQHPRRRRRPPPARWRRGQRHHRRPPYTGVAGGTMLTMPGWASALRRYDIDAPAGVSAISVTSR